MKEKLIIITGPTASGKTSVSVELARFLNGEIINADASQVYKYLDIGTAKITSEEMKGIPHHLFGFLDPQDDFSIKDYQHQARKIISEIISKGKLPFLVGGSGLYINSVITNYQLDGPPRDLEFENQFSNMSNEELFSLLESKNAKVAEGLHPNNRRRVLRKLQLLELNIEEPMKASEYLYDVLIFNLISDRDNLYERINQRTIKMFDDGWLEEAKWLLEQGYDLQKVNGIGYQEIDQYFKQILTYNELIQSIQQKTRRYAKRQITWINNQFKAIDISINEQDLSSAIQEINQKIIEFISTN